MAYVYKGKVPFDPSAPTRTARTPGPKPVFDPSKCGTRAGYRQHLRHDADPCADCKAANAEHSANYRGRKPQVNRVLKPCGTHAAYTRHLNYGEKPCEPCTEAHRIYQAGRRRDEAGRTRLTMKPLNTAACGTYRGYKNHTRRGLKPCQPCAVARLEYYEAWKASQERIAA